ncbi:hypothetical protein C8J57DRAFT_1240529 [Mycena rebaudengoi]|nr:hypothetical protein C8J57DRAFT_1240529 [Mycena rebaudengoi]
MRFASILVALALCVMQVHPVASRALSVEQRDSPPPNLNEVDKRSRKGYNIIGDRDDTTGGEVDKRSRKGYNIIGDRDADELDKRSRKGYNIIGDRDAGEVDKRSRKGYNIIGDRDAGEVDKRSRKGYNIIGDRHADEVDKRSRKGYNIIGDRDAGEVDKRSRKGYNIIGDRDDTTGGDEVDARSVLDAIRPTAIRFNVVMTFCPSDVFSAPAGITSADLFGELTCPTVNYSLEVGNPIKKASTSVVVPV